MQNTSHYMDFQVESDPSAPYVSAPSSPRISFSDFPSSYGAPGSPAHGLTSAPLVWKSGTAGLTEVPKPDLDSDDFEFETSGRLKNTPNQQQQQQKEMVEQLPVMSFADELFSNGLVLPLQFSGTQSSRVSATKSPSFVPSGSFPRASFKNKESDHFRKEQTRTQRRKTHSPLPARSHQSNHEGCPKSPTGVPAPRGPTKQIRPATEQWRRTKGSPVCRSGSEQLASLMRWNSESHVNLTMSKFKPATDTGEQSSKVITRRRWRSFPKGSKRRIVRDFLLFKSASEGRADPKDKLRHRTAALKSTEDVKNSSLWPVQKTHCSEQKIKKLPENKRRNALVPQKPGLFVCLGLSSN